MFLDPTGVEGGVYYINYGDATSANAEFKYIESEHSRIVIAVATKDIALDQEILASYDTR
jgi:SET domain-containing protein